MSARISDRELLERLVAFDTTSSNSNLALVDFLSDYLDRPGVRLHRHLHPRQAKANLVAEVGPPVDPQRRPGLTLCGHTDVVPAGEASWSSDPFAPVERDDAIYGRGTADMKGFIAVAANLFTDQDPSRLRHPLALALTYDEEIGTLGAHHLCDDFLPDHPLPRAVIVGEPTELVPVRVHKGFLRARIVVRGVPAHSAYPHLGHSAVEPAGRLVVALAELRRELEAFRLQSSRHFPEVPSPSLNVGTIHGGSAINVIPDRAVVELGLRLIPGMDPEAAVERLRESAAAALAGEQWELEVTSLSPPLELPAEAPLFRDLSSSPGAVPGACSAAYATDAGWLHQAGYECVVFGPGSIAVAHKPNEHIPLAQLAAARPLLAGVAERFCRRDPDRDEEARV